MHQQSGFPLTSDLGKYLGVPLVHKRVTKATYHHLIEKFQQRLSAWRANCLSFAGRTTLVKAVVAALPAYTMKTSLLPEGVCLELERLQRRFVWGDAEGCQGYHSVSWDKICKPKLEGGMGIKNMYAFNQALIMKLAWGPITKPNALWVQILRAKYNCGQDVLPIIHKSRNHSNSWAGICQVWDRFIQGCKWNIRDGSVEKLCWIHGYLLAESLLRRWLPRSQLINSSSRFARS